MKFVKKINNWRKIYIEENNEEKDIIKKRVDPFSTIVNASKDKKSSTIVALISVKNSNYINCKLKIYK